DASRQATGLSSPLDDACGTAPTACRRDPTKQNASSDQRVAHGPQGPARPTPRLRCNPLSFKRFPELAHLLLIPAIHLAVCRRIPSWRTSAGLQKGALAPPSFSPARLSRARRLRQPSTPPAFAPCPRMKRW